MGEPVSLGRGKGGNVVEINFAGYKSLPEEKIAAEMLKRYRVVGSTGVGRASARKPRRSARRRASTE
jgi:hypothetical protein